MDQRAKPRYRDEPAVDLNVLASNVADKHAGDFVLPRPCPVYEVDGKTYCRPVVSTSDWNEAGFGDDDY